MSESRSDALYNTASAESRKFDYFLTGLTGAALAYLAKDIEAEQLGLNSFTLRILSMIGLAISGYVGLRRIELHGVLLNINAEAAKAGADITLADKAIRDGNTAFLTRTGTEITNNLPTYRKSKALEVRAREEEYQEVNTKALGRYRLRNRTLAFSILLLLISIVAEPYLDSSEPKAEQCAAGKSNRAGE